MVVSKIFSLKSGDFGAIFVQNSSVWVALEFFNTEWQIFTPKKQYNNNNNKFLRLSSHF